MRHWDWSETSQTVSLFTREHGLLRGIAKGAKREKASFSGGIEWLTRGEVVAIVKESAVLANLTAWDLVGPFRGLRERLAAFHAAAFCAELVLEFMQDGDPHPGVFDALDRGLRELSCGVRDVHPVLLEFAWAVVREAGLQPVLSRASHEAGQAYEDVYFFDPETGGLVDTGASGHGWRVRASTIAVIRRTAEGASPQSGEDTTRAVRLLASYLSFRVGRPFVTAEPVMGPLRS